MIKSSSSNLKITAVGDISLGDHPVCVGHGVRSMLETKGRAIFQAIEDELSDADVKICNIETVASNIGYRKYWLPSFEMRGDPKQITTIKDVGFNVFGVANNHAMQHGFHAFEDMIEHIRNAGVGLIGIDCALGYTKPQLIGHGDGSKSAVFAVSMRPEEWVDERPVPYSLRENEDALLDEVCELRKTLDGFLVCYIHWGLEFLDYPGPDQIRLGHALIDAGVDLVLGHHPHVLQPIEEYKNGLIVYSLGNFVFDLWQRSTKLTAIINVELEKGKKPAYEIVPITIGDDLHLYKAEGEDREEILDSLSREIYNDSEGRAQKDETYFNKYEKARKDFRYSSYAYFLSNLNRYPIVFIIQSIARTGLRRLFGK